MAVKKVVTKEGVYLITLPSKPKDAPRVFIKALEKIYTDYGNYEFIPLAYHKNGQLKTIFAFCKEVIS